MLIRGCAGYLLVLAALPKLLAMQGMVVVTCIPPSRNGILTDSTGDRAAIQDLVQRDQRMWPGKHMRYTKCKVIYFSALKCRKTPAGAVIQI